MRTCTYRDPRGYDRCTECGVTVDLCLCLQINDQANRRLNSPNGQFLREVQSHLDATEFSSHLFESLAQDLGTLGNNLVSNTLQGTPEDRQIYQVLVKIAATATRLAIQGTPEYGYPSGREE